MGENLAHLIIVHANMLNPSDRLENSLLQNIRKRALSTLAECKRVFFLPADHSPGWDVRASFLQVVQASTTIPFPVIDRAKKFPKEASLIDLQSIELKSVLVNGGISAVDVVGVSRVICVDAVDHIVRGAVRTALIEDMPAIAQFLNVDCVQSSGDIRKAIRSRVIEQLCH